MKKFKKRKDMKDIKLTCIYRHRWKYTQNNNTIYRYCKKCEAVQELIRNASGILGYDRWKRIFGKELK